MLDLSAYDLIPEQLGGNQICVPISAREKTNLDILRQKIVQVATERVNLLEDYTMPAQCIVIESNIDEKSGQITATLIVKKGTLRIEDVFVSGLHEGKIKFMANDHNQPVKEAYPGEAVHVVGFKFFPDVGNPLYVVSGTEEARFIVSRVQHRADVAKRLKLAGSSDALKVHDMKKAVGKLTRLEK